MFKSGDVVYYGNDTNDVGVVVQPHENNPDTVWVDWVKGFDAGSRLYADIKNLRSVSPEQNSDIKTNMEYTVADLKKLLDKMDDNIVFSFADLRIHCNK